MGNVKKYSDEEAKERKKIAKKKDYEKNRDKYREYHKQYRDKNKDIIKKQQKKWKSSNKDKIKTWWLNNPDYKKQYRSSKKNDVLFVLTEKIRKAILQSFNHKNFKKSSITTQILGCSFEEFKTHLETQFESWMNWQNRGLYNGELNYGWDIDHVIPLATAKTEADIIKLNHYSNLRPLCGKINRNIKRDKID